MTVAIRRKSPVYEATAIQRTLEAIQAEVREAFSDDGNRWETVGSVGASATYSGGPVAWRRQVPLIRDRDEGRYYPFYEWERDLARMRAKCRDLATVTSISVGALQALQVYTLGGAWEFEVIPRAGSATDKDLLAEVQRIVDALLAKNTWVGELDGEIHDASREDGESLIALYGAPDGVADIRRLDADNLREPAGAANLNRWLNLDDDCASWTFGVLTTFDERMQRIDHERHAGYHVVFDDGGSRWDFLPAWPLATGDGDLDAKCGHLVKRNTPRKAKRGVSDFWPVMVDLEREDKLNENTSVGMAILAAIPWIEEFPEGTTRDQASAQLGNALDQFSRTLTAAKGGERTAIRYRAGTPLKVSAGRKYTAGPMGTARHDLYIEVMQAIKRRIGIRWLMPEYMISGDASNANFASTMVSESPFVKAREAEQRQYCQHWRAVLLKGLKLAHDAGRFARFVGSWGELLGKIDLRIQAPPVATRNKTELISELQATFDRGLMDGNEWRQALDMEPKNGLDRVTGSAALVSRFDSTGGPLDQPSTAAQGLPDQEVRLNGAQVTAAADILQQVSTGTTAEITALGLLVGLGISDSLAQRMVKAAVAKAAEVKAARQSKLGLDRTSTAAITAAMEGASIDEARAILRTYESAA